MIDKIKTIYIPIRLEGTNFGEMRRVFIYYRDGASYFNPTDKTIQEYYGLKPNQITGQIEAHGYTGKEGFIGTAFIQEGLEPGKEGILKIYDSNHLFTYRGETYRVIFIFNDSADPLQPDEDVITIVDHCVPLSFAQKKTIEKFLNVLNPHDLSERTEEEKEQEEQAVEFIECEKALLKHIENDFESFYWF